MLLQMALFLFNDSSPLFNIHLIGHCLSVVSNRMIHEGREYILFFDVLSVVGSDDNNMTCTL